MRKPINPETPVAMAAPAIPFCSGYTISQSPKIFAAVQARDIISPSFGFPSFLANVFRHGPSVEERRKCPDKIHKRHRKADCGERVGADAVADKHSVHDSKNKKAEIADHSGNNIFTKIFSLFCHYKSLQAKAQSPKQDSALYYSPFSDCC